MGLWYPCMESVLEQSPENIIHIMVAGNSNNPRLQKIISLARDLGLKLTKESVNKLNSQCKDRHQGVIALIKVSRLRMSQI
ncbi:MAG: RNA methyltransferase substrate-binding domain-containing protein [Gammaproteobacteria bacterium]